MNDLVGYFAFIFICMPVVHGDSPYAPTKVGTTLNAEDIGNYGYDSAGNRLTNKAGDYRQTINIGLLSKPNSIQQGSKTPDQFFYKPNTQRYMRLHESGLKTLYFPGMEYRLDGVAGKSVVYLRPKGYSPDVQIEFGGEGAFEYTYLLKDHLGSPVRSVNEFGDAHDFNRFDPWGLRIKATGEQADLRETRKAEKIRGYTGHELIAAANMNHMNGRVHDSTIGIFLSPDRLIEGSSVVALNRFVLGQNRNPNVTDPTGWKIFYHPAIHPETNTKNFNFVKERVADVVKLRGSHSFMSYFSPIEHSENIIVNVKEGAAGSTTFTQKIGTTFHPDIGKIDHIEINFNVIDRSQSHIVFAHEMAHASQLSYRSEETALFALNYMRKPLYSVSLRRPVEAAINHSFFNVYLPTELKHAYGTFGFFQEMGAHDIASFSSERPTPFKIMNHRQQMLFYAFENDAVLFEQRVARELGIPESNIRKHYHDIPGNFFPGTSS